MPTNSNPLRNIIRHQEQRVISYQYFHKLNQGMLNSVEKGRHNGGGGAGDGAHDNHEEHNHHHAKNCQHHSETSTIPRDYVKEPISISLSQYQAKIAELTHQFGTYNKGIRNEMQKLRDTALVNQDDNRILRLIHFVEDLLSHEKNLFRAEVRKMRLDMQLKDISDGLQQEEFIGEREIPVRKEYAQVMEEIGEERDYTNDLMSELRMMAEEFDEE